MKMKIKNREKVKTKCLIVTVIEQKTNGCYQSIVTSYMY